MFTESPKLTKLQKAPLFFETYDAIDFSYKTQDTKYKMEGRCPPRVNRVQNLVGPSCVAAGPQARIKAISTNTYPILFIGQFNVPGINFRPDHPAPTGGIYTI